MTGLLANLLSLPPSHEPVEDWPMDSSRSVRDDSMGTARDSIVVDTDVMSLERTDSTTDL
jgi:hypothetical protein